MGPMSSERYAKIKATGRLPSPKGVALAIIRLLRRDDYKIDDLVRLIKSDPAIAGRLLKFANTAALGNTRPIVSIAKAAIALGSFRVRDMVLGFSILLDHQADGCPAFDYQRFWSRALACAIGAQALARKSHIAAEECFTLGLLCDVGSLALASVDCDAYTRIKPEQGIAERIAAERTEFDTDHRELGSMLLLEWGIPEMLADAARYSETPDAGGFADGSRQHNLALTLHVARALADICVASQGDRHALLPELYAKAARLGIGPDELAPLADNVVLRWREWGSMLQVQTSELPPFAELLSSIPPAPDAAAQDASQPPTRRALIIGAEATAAELQLSLQEAAYRVTCVANGIDGIMVVLRETPELVIIDIDTPELDGIAFCQALRQNPAGEAAYLLLLGDRDEEDRLAHGIDAGADDYLLRPVTAQMLKVRLRAADKIGHLREEILRERRGLVRSANEWAGSQRRLMAVAMTDPLTRLPNRRHGLDFLSAEWRFAHAQGLSLSCLMIDIDHFKSVNDRYGHDGGDVVLANVAGVLKEVCRSVDLGFRYGGEEFCIICTGIGTTEAIGIAERIRQRIGATHITHNGQKITVTASIGVATMSAQHTDGEQMIKEADEALYRAKQNGRNRVES